MRNPTRRNRNIGTAKQGHGQQNKLVIPDGNKDFRIFYERLGTYEKQERVINGHTFLFVIEKNTASFRHACTVKDVERMLSYISPADYGSLKLIVLRQPKRKEAILSPVWGRLIYAYEFEDDFYPAVILEAADYNSKLKWSRKLDPDDQQELARLRRDGHNFTESKRNYTALLEADHVRSTQLYRTLLHEFGHYVHHLQVVKPFAEDQEKGEEIYLQLPKDEKEKFAHQYADKLRERLLLEKLIPFERQV
ncbi:hypothetical protein AB6805_16395 [Chitinophaga sp. RCC_12]|uniref:hypothetical protein n=1 Tax=Chitinophaga sp. RCC_12 TaxID=3239226 RepID=UPI0035242E46